MCWVPLSRKVVVKYYDGPRRKVNPIVAVARNGVCVGNDRQFIHVRRIICFPGLAQITTVVGKQRRLKWLSTLVWEKRPKDPVKKKNRWKLFHQRRKARKKTMMVPPPPPETHEFVARRLIGAAGDPLLYPTVLYHAAIEGTTDYTRLRLLHVLRGKGFSVDPRPLEQVKEFLGIDDEVFDMHLIRFLPSGEPALELKDVYELRPEWSEERPVMKKTYAEALSRAVTKIFSSMSTP